MPQSAGSAVVDVPVVSGPVDPVVVVGLPVVSAVVLLSLDDDDDDDDASAESAESAVSEALLLLLLLLLAPLPDAVAVASPALMEPVPSSSPHAIERQAERLIRHRLRVSMGIFFALSGPRVK